MRRFKQAIVRQPGENFANGITTANLGKPDYKKALAQHQSYCEALEKCGVQLTILEADPRFPDGCFVEDTAVVLDEAAIIVKPGDIARQGEEEKIAQILSQQKKTVNLNLPATLDGGDIMRVHHHFYIGMSARTNKEGAKQLAEILDSFGYTASQIPVKTVLHLKTGITCVGEDTYISVPEFVPYFSDKKLIVLEKEEYYSANCLLVNDYLLKPKGYPVSYKKLSDMGLQIIEIEMTEFEKMNGGLTCLSLLF